MAGTQSTSWRLRSLFKTFALVLGFISLVFSVVLSAGASESNVGGGGPAVLVLRNGNVLTGGVTKVAGYYQIDLEGATFRVPAGQVEIACGTLDEAYEIRRSQRAGWSADSHVELAGWCLRNNLPDQAAREILDVRSMDPKNPAIAPLETHLKQAFDVVSRRQAREAQRSQASDAKKPSLGKSDRSPLGEARDAEATSALDVDVAEQAQFVRHIQPMLIHSCATGGCHQANATEPMRLDRWALDGGGSPDIIRRNLAEVLAQINAEHPDASPLLEHGRLAHGRDRSRRPSHPLDARQHMILKFWIDEVCGVAYEAPTEPTTPPTDEPLDSYDLAFQEQESPVAVEPTLRPKSTAVRTASREEPESSPRDEFDPELFNDSQGRTSSVTTAE